ncbi:glycosyltransferase family 2 protein [Faecalibacterium prausnitzii]|uniref:glycosyltransferase family 2 protein n=1 Tax=Faecalibacterium prausnitzii TaxID=853 RepID=UPI001FAB0D29|nr:glycosyltransferase family 2 protein [Faecalibacterium prausnitzii]
MIVPVYESEKYLDRCVQSILNQTYQDFELILVDDGSPDNSPLLCDKWAENDSRVYVIHKENGGASSARNAGLKIAKGRWIAFADSDDWLDRTALKTLYDLANQYNVPMAIGGMRVVQKYTDASIVMKQNAKVLSNADLMSRFFRLNGEPDTHSVCGAIIRHDILEDYSFIEGRMNEDVETCYYLARKCEAAVYTDAPLYNYFKNIEGVTNSGFSKKKLDLLDIWDIVQKQVEQFTPEYSYACEMNCKRARFTLLTQMSLNGYDHDDSLMKKTKQQLKKEVRQSFWPLMKWKMPISRKVLLVWECIF